jgi:holo-[acyl-carrier protein] synthase
MIFGIGTDIVENKRIADSINSYGDKFLNKIYTKQEIKYCSSKVDSVLSYAVRFCAKEAFLKALGTGFDGKVSFKDIGVIKDKAGKPFIERTEVIEKVFLEKNIKVCHVSLSHVKEYSIAYVVLEN